MADNPWVPFYFADYLADTGTLSLAEHGAYLLLLAEAYRRGGKLECKSNANASVLHRLCRCNDDADKAAVDAVLSQFFQRTASGFSHKRVQKVLARREEISEKRASAAARRWDANASVLHMQPQPQLQPQLQVEPKTKKRGVVGGGSGGPRIPKPKSTKHALPSDWQPKSSHGLIATEQGLDLAAEAVKFREHALSTGRRMVDWDLCFNTWLRKARDFGARPSGNGANPRKYVSILDADYIETKEKTA